MEVVLKDPTTRLEKTREFLSRARRIFQDRPFKSHPWFRGGNAQTLGAYAWPRRRRYRPANDHDRVFKTADDVKVLGQCRWHDEPKKHPTLILWHGIEGSSTSNYMLSTAGKAFAAGFNVIRMNLRTCGGTEHLTPRIYHGGLTEDLAEVVRQLIDEDGLSRLFLVGFSLGGNMLLKLAGEYAEHAPKEVLAIATISPSVDLQAGAELIMQRSNWIYHYNFVYGLKNRIRRKHRLNPELYDISRLKSVRTLRQFDDLFTSTANGFADADDYYYRGSSLRVIDRIRIPSLIIHAKDDPFIPFAPLLNPEITNNEYILLIDPERGGHVAFLAADNGKDSDVFWAENRVVEFCKLAHETL